MEYALKTKHKTTKQSDRSESCNKSVPAKRVDIVSLKLVREKSIRYANRTIRTADDAYDLLRTFLEDSDREMFVTVCLSTKNEPLHLSISSIGSLDATIVHPREVLKTAVLSGASAILVGHSHPSGNPTPSPQDIQVTQRLTEAGNILGIDILDHLVVGDGRYVSLRAEGHIPPRMSPSWAEFDR